MEKRIKAYLLLTEEWLQGKDKLSEQEREKFRQEYLVHLSFYQHERLVHLLVTILFAILTFLSIGIAIVGGISCHVSGYGSTVYFADSLHPALLFSGKFGSENV